MTKVSNQARIKAALDVTPSNLGAPVTRTATVAGATTGVVAATDKVVQSVGVTGQTGYFLTLPVPVVGKTIQFLGSVFAYKIQTSGNTIGIDGITGTPANLTVAARTPIKLTCTSLTNWQVVVGSGAIA